MYCASALARDVNKQCREIVQHHIAAARSGVSGDKKWLLCNREVSTRLQGKLPR